MRAKTVAVGLLAACLPLWAGAGFTDAQAFADAKWGFVNGPEFPGAKGGFKVAAEEGEPIGILSYDFTGGGLYVAGNGSLSCPPGSREIRLKAKSAVSQKILVRLIDSTGQVHQYELPYSDPENWQPLRIDLAAKSGNAWGGAKDRVVHLPLKRLYLGVDRGGDNSAQPGEVRFKEIRTFK